MAETQKAAYTVLVLIFAMLVGVSSCENSVYPDVPCNCDFQKFKPDPFGEKIPRSADRDPKTSLLGTWLSYQAGYNPTYIIQNLRTRDRAEVNIEPALKPDESLYFLSLSAWCPYDDNVALVTAEVRYVNPQGIAKTGRQLFTYNVITQKSERITPTQFGDSTIFPDDIQWKPFSSPNNDTLVFNSGSYSSLEPRKMRPWLYLVQSDSIVVATTGTKRWWASNGNVFEYRRNIYPDELSVNGKTINIPIGTLQRMSWSPSGKFFLISSDLDNRPPCGSSEVWIYEASQESFDKPRHVVNLVSKYCLFSSWGTQASFLTDSTIIMSFHNYGDDKAYLYEVSFYGNIVKQVTY